MKTPFMSVLMPVYNAQKFLHESIESVLNQTYSDFEFIIIDDGSTDGSDEIIRSFRDDRIRYLKNEKNVGISETLNSGIQIANSDYIARMDADDICYPERLQKQFEFIQSYPDGSLYSCWAMEVNEDRTPIKVERLNPDHYYYNLTFACWIYHSTMVYRRDAVMTIGKYTEKYAEDFELAWQLSRKFKMYHLPAVLLEYRHCKNSLWKITHKKEYHESFLRQVRRNAAYYLEIQDTKIENWQLELLSYSYDASKKFSYSIDQICICLNLLDLITQQILCKENINRDTDAILMAAKEKWEYTLLLYSHELGRYKGFLLLVKSNSWNLVFKIIVTRLKGLLIRHLKII